LTIVGEGADDVQVVFVTTDPLRDTPQAIADYLAKFDPVYVGIPGAPDQLAKIWNAYNVQVLNGGETHSSFTYVIDKGGNLRLRFDPETGPEDIASDVKTLLSEN
jgi:protein SCO1/2